MSLKNQIIFFKNNNKSLNKIFSFTKKNEFIIRNSTNINKNYINKSKIDETVIKTPTPKEPHTDPRPQKPNKLDPKGGVPRKPKEEPNPFPNGPKKPKPSDFPIPDELYPQPA